jgi:hypothetical protein
MIRPVFTELVLFLTPFAVYALFLWTTRAGVTLRSNWAPERVAWLAIVGLVFMIGCFVVIAEWGGAPPGSTYVPAHMENGQFVPGNVK